MRFNLNGRGRLEYWLSPTEAEVMEVVWSYSVERVWAVRDLIRILQKDDEKNRAYTTFATTVERLVEKGFLRERGKRRRLRLVQATFSESAFFEKYTHQTLQRLFECDPSTFRRFCRSILKEGGKE